jgi:hypothetical protein
MTPRLLKAKYVEAYKIELSFSDGKCGIIDLENELWGEVFEPLKDLCRFQEFTVDPELKTIVWSTGADLAPEFLYQQAAA